MFLLKGTFKTNNYKRKIITLYPFNVSNYSIKKPGRCNLHLPGLFTDKQFEFVMTSNNGKGKP
ncbi:hypothetical protein JCM13267_05800 [Howardella ureilytica]